MSEIEKRVGMNASRAGELKDRLNGTDKFSFTGNLSRTVLIKTGEGFQPDPDSLTDVKVKLIDDESILSVKHGSWHGAAERTEYETHFDREDLPRLVGSVALLSSSDKFILLSTTRSVWEDERHELVLDEYASVDKALFEVEANERGDVGSVDGVFQELDLTPMNSAQTVSFIGDINRSKEVHIDLTKQSPEEVAEIMLERHMQWRLK